MISSGDELQGCTGLDYVRTLGIIDHNSWARDWDAEQGTVVTRGTYQLFGVGRTQRQQGAELDPGASKIGVPETYCLGSGPQ